MSYASPELESHIRARALALSEALAAAHPTSPSFASAREELRKSVADMGFPSDNLTWFAMQRVAGQSGARAVLLSGPDQQVPAGSLVLVDPQMPAPEETASAIIKSLRSAAFVVAPSQWETILSKAGINAFRVAPSEDDAPAPSRRSPGPGV